MSRLRSVYKMRPCTNCGTMMKKRETESLQRYALRKFCSPNCANQCRHHMSERRIDTIVTRVISDDEVRANAENGHYHSPFASAAMGVLSRRDHRAYDCLNTSVNVR